MASEEFISLGAPAEADVKDEPVEELLDEAAGAKRVEPVASELQLEGGASAVTDDPVEELPDEATGAKRVEPVASELQVEGGASAVTDDQMRGLQDNAASANAAEPVASELQPEGGAGAVSSSTNISDGNIDLEEGQVDDMDLEDDDVVVAKHQKLDALVQSETSVTAIHGFSVELDKGNGVENALIDASTTISVDESRIL